MKVRRCIPMSKLLLYVFYTFITAAQFFFMIRPYSLCDHRHCSETSQSLFVDAGHRNMHSPDTFVVDLLDWLRNVEEQHGERALWEVDHIHFHNRCHHPIETLPPRTHPSRYCHVSTLSFHYPASNPSPSIPSLLLA